MPPEPCSSSVRNAASVRDALLAQEIASLTRELDAILQPRTDSVCPSCAEVCCRNRFSVHDAYDLACLRLAGEPAPAYRQDIADADPCQFLGSAGCTLSRACRPYRCNWFFCSPLLEHISEALPAPEYRRLLRIFEEISSRRLSLSAGAVKT